MAESLIYFFVTLIVFLIFTEIISVRVYYNKSLRIDIDFMLFGITFTPKKKHINSKNKTIRKKKRNPPSLSLRKEAFGNIIKSSEITIYTLNIGINSDSAFTYPIFRAGIYSFISSVITYLSHNSKKISYHNIFCKPCDNNNLELTVDFKITFPLLFFIKSMIIFALKYFREGLKSKNVGKQNE